MTKDPYLNALTASLYIVLVASTMFYGTRAISPVDSIVVPIAVISLFTLSVAVMGYLFLYEPIRLYFDNHKKEAVRFFLQTVGIFAIITIIILTLLFSNAY